VNDHNTPHAACQQTPITGVMPKLPAQFDTFPFAYASLQCQWMYWYTTIEAAEPFVKGTGLCVARFPVEIDGEIVDRAVILLNFQRYTAHYDNSLGTVNEVEFNLLAYPANRSPGVPEMPLWEYLYGRDQTKTIGHLRLHVAADNKVAVQAGYEVFGEPKFYAEFRYKVPSLNAKMLIGPSGVPEQSHTWHIDLVNPDDPETLIYHLEGDFSGYQWNKTNNTPIPEFATKLGRTVWTRWTIMGMFDTVLLSGEQSESITISFGDNDFIMTRDMRRLFTDRQPVAVQIFESQPACLEPRGFYVDALDGGPQTGGADD
jgi:hypothetical protein